MHNFVDVDLTAPAPAPPAQGKIRLSVVLLDASSVVRRGDTLTFDTLAISKTFGHFMSGNREVGPPEGTIVFNTESFQASCGWRTERAIATSATQYIEGKRYQPFEFLPQFLQDSFLAPYSQFTAAIDKICEGQPVNAVRGFQSVEAAVNAWKDNFSVLPTMVPRIVSQPPPQTSMGGPASAQFRVIATDATVGNLLLIDIAHIERDGSSASAQSLALLGPDAQRFGGGNAVASLRNVKYDCSARTMTVIGQASWDRNERYAGETKAPFSPRSATESPIIKTEIDTACHDAPLPPGPDYPSVQAAWHAERESWPPSALSSWLPCLWSQASIKERDAYDAQWTGAFDDKLFQLDQGEISPALLNCAVPPNFGALALDKLRFYATERSALQRLTNRKLDEPKILAAWRGLGWSERLNLIHDFQSFATSDIEYGLAFKDRFATSLGLRTSDVDGRKWLGEYIRAQAWIEGP